LLGLRGGWYDFGGNDGGNGDTRGNLEADRMGEGLPSCGSKGGNTWNAEARLVPETRRLGNVPGAGWDTLFGLSYLVDPASSHMLVSKIKPCMCKYKLILYCETANGSLNQL
jgi:hypothetical protein